MDIQVLTPGSARLWFAALSAAAPPAEDIGRIEGLLEAGPLRPHMRMVVQHQDGPFGRMAAQVKERSISFWNPAFRDGTPIGVRLAAMRSMIHFLAGARQDAGLAHLVLETRPGDDLPDNELWLQALREEGYSETCAYRAYVLPLDRPRGQSPERPGLSFCDIGPDREQDLLTLYRRVKADTLEQRDVGLDQPDWAIQNKKTLGRGHDSSTWIMAHIDGQAAGYALANLADEDDGERLSAWLVDIGCVPEQRRKGIAAALLNEVLRRIEAAGARQLLAAIDDVNLPSIRLHLSLGFQAQPDRHYIYQLPAKL